jgi:nucleotide-binding universal stress UspA family protein
MKTFILATDGSPQSQKAAQWATDLMMKYPDARLITVHAMDPLVFTGDAAIPPVVFEEQKKEAQKIWQQTKEILGQAAPRCTFRNLSGHPVRVICDVADEEDADLIIMGCHGRSMLDRMILGSVSHGVLNRAKRPVLVVR